MKTIDLFSGLGGFSQAFLDRGHTVIRFDFNKRFENVPCTTIKDVYDLTSKDLEGAKIILASPPCTHFSVASIGKHWKGGKPSESTKEQIRLVMHTIKIIKEANPNYWMLENPRGMMRRVLGLPQITQFWGSWGKNYLKPTDLWGILPPVEWRPKESATYEKAPRGSGKGLSRIKDPAIKALIPYDFSLAVCLAVEGNSTQRTLEEFC